MHTPHIYLPLALIASALFSSAPLSAQVTTGQQIIEATSIANIDRYALYIPASYNDEPNKKWPLMVNLHGTGGFADMPTQAENIEILLRTSNLDPLDTMSSSF
jgi:poly(3-hydroxybutyrate) depolymerase